MTRIDYFKEKPEFITKLRNLTKEQESFKLDGKLRALIELRVSQINGCVYCINLHSREAQALGEAQPKLDSLAAWHESSLFDDREKAALAWAESLTLIFKNHADATEYALVRKHFSDTEVIEMSLAISLANFWNRMAGGFRKNH
jgi:AhpD family alkylhydroperoxidase